MSKEQRAAKAHDWWRDMQDFNEHDGKPNKNADRASRARLRRASSEGVVVEPALIALYNKLNCDIRGFDEKQFEIAKRVALVLAHVRGVSEDKNGHQETFARQLGLKDPKDEKSAVLSTLRFRRLLAARGEEEIIREFRRAVALVGGKANVLDLALLLLSWEDEKTQTRFAFDYFGGAQATP